MVDREPIQPPDPNGIGDLPPTEDIARLPPQIGR
jgi:hypothetical protein